MISYESLHLQLFSVWNCSWLQRRPENKFHQTLPTSCLPRRACRAVRALATVTDKGQFPFGGPVSAFAKIGSMKCKAFLLQFKFGIIAKKWCDVIHPWKVYAHLSYLLSNTIWVSAMNIPILRLQFLAMILNNEPPPLNARTNLSPILCMPNCLCGPSMPFNDQSLTLICKDEQDADVNHTNNKAHIQQGHSWNSLL